MDKRKHGRWSNIFNGVCCRQNSRIFPAEQSAVSARNGVDNVSCTCFRQRRLSYSERRKRHTLKVASVCVIFSTFMVIFLIYDLVMDCNKLTSENITHFKISEIILEIRNYICVFKYISAQYLAQFLIKHVDYETFSSLNKSLRCQGSDKTRMDIKYLNNQNSTLCGFDNMSHTNCSYIKMTNIEKYSHKKLEGIATKIKVDDEFGVLSNYRSCFLAVDSLIKELLYAVTMHANNSTCSLYYDSYILSKYSASVHSTVLHVITVQASRNFTTPSFAATPQTATDSRTVNMESTHSITEPLLNMLEAHKSLSIDRKCSNTSTASFSSYLMIINELIQTIDSVSTHIEYKINRNVRDDNITTSIRISINSILFVILFAFVTIVIYVVNAMNISMFAYSDKLKEKSEEFKRQKLYADKLLYQMLPQYVANQLIQNNCVPAESFDSVTIFFSDIVGFTEISAHSTPMQVVALLNDLYSTFDVRIETYDVYKVETIGDAYMVASGVPVRNGGKHVEEIATMSIDLLAAIKQVKHPIATERSMEIRVGIHTALRIHVSKQTRDILHESGKYILTSRGFTEIKGKGALETFWLHTRSDMTEANQSMVCKYNPKGRRKNTKVIRTLGSMSAIPEMGSISSRSGSYTSMSISELKVKTISDTSSDHGLRKCNADSITTMDNSDSVNAIQSEMTSADDDLHVATDNASLSSKSDALKTKLADTLDDIRVDDFSEVSSSNMDAIQAAFQAPGSDFLNILAQRWIHYKPSRGVHQTL